MGDMAYKAKCTSDRPMTPRVMDKLRSTHGQVKVAHEDVAYSEVLGGYFCVACGWELRGRQRK